MPDRLHLPKPLALLVTEQTQAHGKRRVLGRHDTLFVVEPVTPISLRRSNTQHVKWIMAHCWHRIRADGIDLRTCDALPAVCQRYQPLLQCLLTEMQGSHVGDGVIDVDAVFTEQVHPDEILALEQGNFRKLKEGSAPPGFITRQLQGVGMRAAAGQNAPIGCVQGHSNHWRRQQRVGCKTNPDS